MVLPFEIGAVVLGVSSERQTPLSGQSSPVLARVPRGFRMVAAPFTQFSCEGEASTLESKFDMIRTARIWAGFSPLRSRLEAVRSLRAAFRL
jgi:hypothetical protein